MAECGGASAAASAPRFNKKSFEFRMCKKVAELTQVVHMLFVKNHEREVELESVKMAYEEEIASVIADARSKIEKLQQSLAAEQRRSDSVKKGFEQNLEEKEKQLSQKLAESGVKVRELQKDNEFLRDQVVRLQRIVEDSESTQAVAEEDELKLFQEQLDLARAEIQEKTGKLSRLQEMIGNEADQRRENDAIVSRLKSEMEQMQFELSAQMEDLKNELLDASNSKEKLRQKNKNLESDIRNLKKELETRRLSEFNPAPRSSLQSPPSMDTSEELERLRREVRMYRMELSNREGNFNRMFTDSLPVRIDQRAGVVGAGRNRPDMNIHLQSGRSQMVGNRTLKDSNGNSQYRPGLNRLPTLSMDSRQRVTNSRSGGRHHTLTGSPRERQANSFSMPGFH